MKHDQACELKIGWVGCYCKLRRRLSCKSQSAGYLKMTVSELAEMWGSAYQGGHEDTVEARFRCVDHRDYAEEHLEDVTEHLSGR